MQEPGAYLNNIQLSYTIPEPTRAMTDARMSTMSQSSIHVDADIGSASW